MSIVVNLIKQGVNLFFVYTGRNGKLKLIVNDDEVDTIEYGRVGNIRKYIYKLNNEINSRDYLEFEYNYFTGLVNRGVRYNNLDELFNFCKQMNFIYGESTCLYNKYGGLREKN